MTEQVDAFGGGGRKIGRGYAAPPGTGPDGQTCGTCCNVRRQSATQGRYLKCGIGNITRGAATDILMRSPACSFWEKAT